MPRRLTIDSEGNIWVFAEGVGCSTPLMKLNPNTKQLKVFQEPAVILGQVVM
jgi:streptogramin lyase